MISRRRTSDISPGSAPLASGAISAAGWAVRRTARRWRHSRKAAAASSKAGGDHEGIAPAGHEVGAASTSTTLVAVLAWATSPSRVSATSRRPCRDGRGTPPRSSGTETVAAPEAGTATSSCSRSGFRPRGVSTRRRTRWARPSALSRDDRQERAVAQRDLGRGDAHGRGGGGAEGQQQVRALALGGGGGAGGGRAARSRGAGRRDTRPGRGTSRGKTRCAAATAPGLHAGGQLASS